MVVSFHELSKRELNDAARYYEHERAAAIVEHPEAGPVVRGKVRRHFCRRFPYALLYTVQVDEVRILAVMNLRRRPTYWVARS